MPDSEERHTERGRPPALEEKHPERGRLIGDRYVRIVRPSAAELKRVGRARFEATERALEPETALGRVYERARRILIGQRLRSEADITERVSKKAGLGIFAVDNISSSAYATEAIMRVLILAGAGALALTLPLTLAVIGVMAAVIFAESRVIRAYPRGGGSYQVSVENLGMFPGLVAGAALLIDYTLTVAVSVAAGVAALSSAFPEVHEHRVLWAVGFIALLALGNLRGVRESGAMFSFPTYLYVGSFFLLIGYGVARYFAGDLPVYQAPPEWIPPADAVQLLTIVLVLRAFATGAVGLTGTEAIANTVPSFKPPEPRNAILTLVFMGLIFGTIFTGLSFLATTMHIIPDPVEAETVNSQIVRALIGDGPAFLFVQAVTALLLLLAANTAFNGFPRLASILARDRFMPRQFAFRGERLAFSTGIIALAVFSSAILAFFGGSVVALIPLYTIGVFVAFTLSQSGLVRRWRRLRPPGWRLSVAVNGVGAVLTGVVLVIVAVTKFTLGAWLVILVMPILVALLYGVHRHYRAVEDALVVTGEEPPPTEVQRPIVVVPVSRLDRPTLRALGFAKALAGDVVAIHISDDEDASRTITERWQRWVGSTVPLTVIDSPYRNLIEPILAYLDAVDRDDPGRPVTVILSEFVPRHWWEYPLHNQNALRLKLRLFFRPNTVVVDVPYHLGQDRVS